LGILPQVLGKVFDKDVGAQPVEIASVLSAKRLVACCPSLGKISQGIGGDFSGSCSHGLVHAKQSAVTVVIIGAGVEQSGVLRANRQRQTILQRVQKYIIAQDVATDGKEERMTATFQPLE